MCTGQVKVAHWLEHQKLIVLNQLQDEDEKISAC